MEHQHHDHCSCGCGEHEHHDSCCCGEHEQHESCGCGCGCDCGCGSHSEKSELPVILSGAGLFAAGLVLHFLDFGLSSMLVCGIAAALLGWEILLSAAKSLTKGHMLDENFLMSLAAIGAFFIGEAPEAVGILLFYRLGEWFEHRAVERSRSRIMEAVDLRPETVTLADGTVIAAAKAKVGDVLLVRPGDRIPLDSTVVSGESRVDTAPITGEPVPVAVRPGDPVTSGCVNTSALLTVRVEKPLSESMVTRILRAVENAAAGKPKMDRFITRFARIYTPVVVGIAVITAILPSLITQNWSYWVYTALSFLVMSCPCALVLSVPLAFFSGVGAGSKKGILFKGGASMEALAAVRAVALDKTGTLTKGEFRVQNADDALLRLCACCEQNSSHPIAVSIVAAAQEKNLELIPPEHLEELPGQGIRGVVAGKTVLCGNEKLLRRFGVEIPGQVSGVLVAVDGVYAGSITVSDSLKPGASDAICKLHKLGLATAILTGDSAENADAVSAQLGIPRVFARLLPEEKLQTLQALRNDFGAVMFIGDGINDAPVLAGADVGAAMGSGADAAIEAADVVFLTSEVGAIPEAVRLARHTRSIAWQNVIFALAVKILVMALGLLGFASMWMAVFADSGVAILCVLNSIRLLYRKG